MSIIPRILSKNSKNQKVKIRYQPDYPLRYDHTHGPYVPITSLEESLQKNFENLLLTNPGEWPMHPEMGIGLKTYLFSAFGGSKISELQARINDQLNRFLPSIQLLKLELLNQPADQDVNFLGVRIIYSILGKTVVDSSTKKDQAGNLKIEVSSFEKEFSSFRDRRSNLRSQITQI
tara:strand:+ start:2168 stop:2695 length:528 start_codon:yes stop_codon:yes gene_type:complete